MYHYAGHIEPISIEKTILFALNISGVLRIKVLLQLFIANKITFI